MEPKTFTITVKNIMNATLDDLALLRRGLLHALWLVS